MGERVLIVEDEAKLAGLLRDYLASRRWSSSFSRSWRIIPASR